MGTFAGFTAYDFVVLGLFGLLIGRGIWLGFLKQVTGLLALYLGYFVASQHIDKILPLMRDISDNPQVIFITGYVVLFIVTYIVVMLLGKALGYVINMTITGWFDRLLGGLVGFAKAAIVVIFMHMILGTLLAPENQLLRSCATCEVLSGASKLTRDLIQNEEVRKSFLQHEPAIALDAVKNYLTPSQKSAEPPPQDSQQKP